MIRYSLRFATMRPLFAVLAVLLFLIPAGLAQSDILDVPNDAVFGNAGEVSGEVTVAGPSLPLLSVVASQVDVSSGGSTTVTVKQKATASCANGRMVVDLYQNGKLLRTLQNKPSALKKGITYQYVTSAITASGLGIVAGDVGVQGYIFCDDIDPRRISAIEQATIIFRSATQCVRVPEVCSNGKDDDCDGTKDEKACTGETGCSSQVSTACYNGDIYYLNSCGKREDGITTTACGGGRCPPAVDCGSADCKFSGGVATCVATEETVPGASIGDQFSQIVMSGDSRIQVPSCVKPNERFSVRVPLYQEGNIVGSTKIEAGIYTKAFAEKTYGDVWRKEPAVLQSIAEAPASAAQDVPNCVPSESFVDTDNVSLRPGQQITIDLQPESPNPSVLSSKDFILIVGVYQTCGQDGYDVPAKTLAGSVKVIQARRMTVSATCDQEPQLTCNKDSDCASDEYCDSGTTSASGASTCQRRQGDQGEGGQKFCDAFTEEQVRGMTPFVMVKNACYISGCPVGSAYHDFGSLGTEKTFTGARKYPNVLTGPGGIIGTLKTAIVGDQTQTFGGLCVIEGEAGFGIDTTTLILIGVGLVFLFIVFRLVG